MNPIPKLSPHEASLLARLASVSGSAQLYVNYSESNPTNFLLAGLELLQQLTFEALLLCHQAPNKFHFDHAARMTKLMAQCRQQELDTLRTIHTTASSHPVLFPVPQPEFPPAPVHNPPPTSNSGNQVYAAPPTAPNSDSGDFNAANPSPCQPGLSTGSSNTPEVSPSASLTPGATPPNPSDNGTNYLEYPRTANRIRIAKSRLPLDGTSGQSGPAQAPPAKPPPSPEVPEFSGILQSDFDARVLEKYQVLKHSHWTWQECAEVVRRDIRTQIKNAALEKAAADKKAGFAGVILPTGGPPGT